MDAHTERSTAVHRVTVRKTKIVNRRVAACVSEVLLCIPAYGPKQHCESHRDLFHDCRELVAVHARSILLVVDGSFMVSKKNWEEAILFATMVPFRGCL